MRTLRCVVALSRVPAPIHAERGGDRDGRLSVMRDQWPAPLPVPGAAFPMPSRPPYPFAGGARLTLKLFMMRHPVAPPLRVSERAGAPLLGSGRL